MQETLMTVMTVMPVVLVAPGLSGQADLSTDDSLEPPGPRKSISVYVWLRESAWGSRA